MALWCLLCSPVSGAENDAVLQLHQLVLPEFVVEKATLKQGIAKIEAAWTKKYPDQSFPVVLLESLEHESDSKLASTMKLKNVPALSAVTYLAQAHGMSVRHALDLVVLRPLVPGDNSAWESVMLRLSKESIAALSLSLEADNDEASNRKLKKTLSDFGISFTAGFDIRWFGGSKQLFLRNTPEEISKIKGLVMLFEAGFEVSRPDKG